MMLNCKELLDKLIEKYEKEGHSYKTELNEFRCSQLNICPRKMYYAKKYGIKPDDYTKGIFTVGHILHKEIQNILSDKFDCEVPVKYKDDLSDIILVGHADLVSDDIVIDIKTVKRLPDEPYINHHLQVNTYATILKKQYYGLLYVEKNSLLMRYFEYKQNNKLFNYILDKCRTVYYCLKTDTLPEKTPNSLCRYCQYNEICNYNFL